MLKITRAYLDACGYVDGVFEELLVRPVGEDAAPVHHVIHAPNGVGKTTILALLFSIFEPDRRKFLRTEINRQHKIEHYFLHGRLGVIALELVKPGINNKPVRHVIGQVFWLTPAKGDEGEPGQRRFFAFEVGGELSLDALPFRGLAAQSALRSLDDYMRWAREMRSHASFFATDSLIAWRKYLTSELGIDLKVIEVQRHFCATEGGIGAAFLNFKSEQQFLEKIFSFMIPSDAAESVVMALETGLEKIRGLPQRKDQLKVLSQLADSFAPFFAAAGALEAAEAARAEDFKRLGRLFTRFKLEQSKLDIERNTVEGEIAVNSQTLEDASKRERTLHGEILFLEKTAADRRVSDAKVAVEKMKADRDVADRHLQAAQAAEISRKLASARQQQADLEAELDRIERDLAPDRARLARAGANLHALLDQIAAEAEGDSLQHDKTAQRAEEEAREFGNTERVATARAHALGAEIKRLSERIAECDLERKELERSGAIKAGETSHAAIARLEGELRTHEDNVADIELRDEQLQGESTNLEGQRAALVAEVRRTGDESERLFKFGETGQRLETAIEQSELLAGILAGEAKDPYRLDLPERVRSAIAGSEEARRKIANERETIASELTFLDVEGVSSVPEDVALVVSALKDAGFADAQAAEHYLAQFKPDAHDALALLRQDPARFSGVFVSRLDSNHLVKLSAENRLKLKGPVLVSQATLEPSTTSVAGTDVVFGPFSAARVNKKAAAEEKTRLTEALAQKESSLADVMQQIRTLQTLGEQLRDLHATYGEQRPAALLSQAEVLRHEKEKAEVAANEAIARRETIATERGVLRTQVKETSNLIRRLQGSRQAVEQFARRYPDIAGDAAGIPGKVGEQHREEEAAAKAGASANDAREFAGRHRTDAATLRVTAAARRQDKVHYPETDGGPADRIGTVDDLRDLYKSAEQVLASKRDGQQAAVSLRLASVKGNILAFMEEDRTARQGLVEADLQPFVAVADLQRTIKDAEARQSRARGDVVQAEAALISANSALGPVSGKIDRAREKNGFLPIVVPGFLEAAADACADEAIRRQTLLDTLEDKIRTLRREHNDLEKRHAGIKEKLSNITSLTKRAEGHLPDFSRDELADLGVRFEDLEAALDQLISRLSQAIAEIGRLERDADNLFDLVRQIIEGDRFRQLEPQVADHLRRYSARSAGAERATLQARLTERISIVQGEIDNQVRDQNACLEQLRLHVTHADDLLHRAARCSKIPENVAFYGGERILKIRRRLKEVPTDMIRNHLSIWLDEQVMTGRIPKDGATLAAELLSRVHGGRALEIEIMKPKRDAIQPYMRVDRMGLSGGEGVTVAMMLYTVIQKMAMDERADGKNAASGGFLMLDNTYGMSNMMEHIVLQKTMADVLDIQLFVTTCSEDKHILNMFPTITRLVQGERVLLDGVPRYNRVRSGDYLFKGSDHAA